ncbi:MAG: glycosyltransferase family 2 protein [Planctomycetes bacterium]|nr:glycosyltransferase family 2 protein [Planctomycetota bacterium]
MLSIVIPVFNEAESLVELHQEIDEVARDENYDVEVIFVDDGSRDGSWSVVEQMAASDARVRGVRFRRNFGKAAALDAGFGAARGDLVMTLDADLQDDPHEIPRFLAKLNEGFDVVSGWKQVRHDPWHKVGPSRVFNWLVGRLTGVKLHDHNCGFKCYRREIFSEVRLYGELHRFVPVLAHARGWRVGELVVNHRPRKHGQSKYGVKRIVKGFLDLLTVHFLTGFGQRPQHLLGAVGLLCFLLGGVAIVCLLAYRVLSWSIAAWEPWHMHTSPWFYISITSLLLGAQFMSIGFLAELITAYLGRDTHAYSIQERAGFQDEEEAASGRRGNRADSASP